MSSRIHWHNPGGDLRFFETSAYNDASEGTLLAASRDGDSLAFAELCRRHIGTLKRKVIMIVRNREDAEDVCQETLMKAYRNLDRFQGTCQFQTWLVRIGINTSFMLLRKRKVRLELTIDSNVEEDWCDGSLIHDSAPNPEQQYVGKQTCRLLAQSVACLRGDFRHLLRLHYTDERSVAELALDLGISTAAVKAKMHRARRLLRERLKPCLMPSHGR